VKKTLAGFFAGAAFATTALGWSAANAPTHLRPGQQTIYKGTQCKALAGTDAMHCSKKLFSITLSSDGIFVFRKAKLVYTSLNR
jgi:hypothetical protein